MSPNALPATAPSRPGCGCGGGCGVSAADPAGTAFVRPRFFAGQLLTEDDLGLLTTYVTGKDRLHNRYLFGAGVVCGLWVACDPCGGGTVSVQPGYALDCCGNDLVLACATTLDVNAMIRDLRARLGKDCGDPCNQGSQSGTQQQAVTRRYCLYARYGEEATDPVAPYATEEPCGQTACEPTRVREGVSFVLKCPEHEPPPQDLWCRLRQCLPPQDILGGAVRLMAYGTPMISAAEAAAHPGTFGREDADELRSLLTDLGEEPPGIDPAQTRQVTETVRALAALLARYDLAKDRPQLDEIAKARASVRDVATALRENVDRAWDDPLDRAAVGALLNQAAELAEPAASQPAPQLAMLAQGRPINDSVLAVLRSSTDGLLEWLLARVDSDPTLADCELRSKVAALSVTTATTIDEAALRSLGGTSSDLIDLVTRYLLDCICAALNPPCAPCEDTDVLLACLEVRDCKVVRICNAERDYVVNGSALRYWLPAGLLHEQIESFCCQDRPKYRQTDKEPGRLSFQKAGFAEATPAGVPWELLSLPQPGGPLRSALQRAGIPFPAPAVPEGSRTPQVPPPSVPAAGAGPSDAVAQQITALAQRVTQLTGQLTDTGNRLADTQSRLTRTQTQLTETRTQLTALADRPTAPPSPASRARRTRGTKSPPATQPPPAAPGQGAPGQPAPAPGGAGPASAETPATSTAGPAAPEAPSKDNAGPAAPEAGDGT